MNSSRSLPPDADAWLADFPDLDASDLDAPWRLAEGANPLHQAPAPDPARIAALRATLERAAAPDRPVLRLVRWAPWMAAAACLVLLLSAGLFWYSQPLEFTAPTGQTAKVDLPDGSTVMLESESTLTYARTFGRDTRTVSLEGEAFFDVATTGTAFVIETFNAEVRVLGTSFDVRAWPALEAAETEVRVHTGIVQVTPQGTPEAALRLAANDMVTVGGSASDPSAAMTLSRQAGPRVQRGLFFYDATYAEIFERAGDRFDVALTAAPPLLSRRRTFTTHQVESIEAFLNDFCQSAGLRYREVAGGYEIIEAAPDQP